MEIIKIMYLYGASGHGKVIKDIVEASGGKVQAFIDDNPNVNELCRVPVIHEASGCSPVIVSIGVNHVRKMIVEKLQCDFGKAIHPSAIISPSVKIDEGTVAMAGVLVNAETVIGKHCIVNTGVSIDHECKVGDFVHISPHATLCGNVTVGEGTWIGAGTTVIQGVKIGRWCIVGAGSVVTKDIPDGYLAVGNRCKFIKAINKELL